MDAIDHHALKHCISPEGYKLKQKELGRASPFLIILQSKNGE
jgi:hypothetical protein